MNNSSNAGPAELRQQQQAFEAAVLGRHITGLLHPAPNGAEPAIDVYRHAYTARLTGALRDNFEILAQAAGRRGLRCAGRRLHRRAPLGAAVDTLVWPRPGGFHGCQRGRRQRPGAAPGAGQQVESADQAAPRVVAALQQWLADGLLSGLRG